MQALREGARLTCGGGSNSSTQPPQFQLDELDRDIRAAQADHDAHYATHPPRPLLSDLVAVLRDAATQLSTEELEPAVRRYMTCQEPWRFEGIPAKPPPATAAAAAAAAAAARISSRLALHDTPEGEAQLRFAPGQAEEQAWSELIVEDGTSHTHKRCRLGP